jgi:SAM-dependent methyltransferase
VRARDELLEKLWEGADPFAGIAETANGVDLQGWHSEHPLLRKALESNPRIVVEVGVWKGGSVAFMARCLRDAGADAVVVAVDTWLGSWEHWDRPEWRADLRLEVGYPTLYRTFQSNIVCSGLGGYVIPLPLDSVNAAALLGVHGVAPDVVHVDAGHDYRSVLTDLETWWHRLRPGGILVADDYDPSGEHWPRVREAIDEFARDAGPAHFEAAFPKALMRKPAASAAARDA